MLSIFSHVNPTIAPQHQQQLFLRCSETAPCGGCFHCILALKLCPAALSLAPSALVKLTKPEMQKHIFFQSAFTSSVLKELFFNFFSTIFFPPQKCFLKNNNNNNLHLFPVYLGTTHLTELDVLQSGRRTCKHWGKVRGGEDCESVGGGKRTPLACFLITAQKMNMSARVVFGKGRLPPKHLSFILPQADPARKGGRPAGGKKRLFSFSIRCRVGIIRGRTKGKPLVATGYFFAA